MDRGRRQRQAGHLFRRTLLTREYSAIDKQYEKKWYARGVGVVQEDAITKSGEHSELVSVTVP